MVLMLLLETQLFCQTKNSIIYLIMFLCIIYLKLVKSIAFGLFYVIIHVAAKSRARIVLLFIFEGGIKYG